MSQQLWWWWHSLVAISLFNALAWGYASARLRAVRLQSPAVVLGASRWQLWLSAAYVTGCAYRSFFPVFDVPRLCLVDGAWSSVVVGRSVATVAELCFAFQWALLARAVAEYSGSRALAQVARVLPFLIVVAEVSSWYAVLTQANIGHVLEESLWACGAAWLSVTLLGNGHRLPVTLQAVCRLVSLVGLSYAAYLVAIDVPMYWDRWVAQEASGHVYLGLEQGLWDIAHNWRVSLSWEDWRSEVVWMSLYFSVGVWCSIGLVHLHHRLTPAPLR